MSARAMGSRFVRRESDEFVRRLFRFDQIVCSEPASTRLPFGENQGSRRVRAAVLLLIRPRVSAPVVVPLRPTAQIAPPLVHDGENTVGDRRRTNHQLPRYLWVLDIGVLAATVAALCSPVRRNSPGEWCPDQRGQARRVRSTGAGPPGTSVRAGWCSTSARATRTTSISLNVALVYQLPDKPSAGNWRIGLIADNDTSDEQAAALEAGFTGKDGGLGATSLACSL